MKEQIPQLLLKAFDYLPMEVFDANPKDGSRVLPLSCMSVRSGIHLGMRKPDRNHDCDGNRRFLSPE